MRATVAALLLILPLAGSGCISGEDIDRWWDDLRSEPRFEDAVLFNETVDFDFTGLVPTGPPSGPESFGATYENTFEVPAGTTQLRVLFLVNFTELPAPMAPANPIDNIVIYVDPPSGDADRTENEFQASGGGSLDTRHPDTGTWTLGFSEARGVGQVTFRVEAVVPITTNATAANGTLLP